MSLRFERDDPTRAAVHRLLEEHLADMYATSPAESVHALDLARLRQPEIEFWTAWHGEQLHATGALRRLSDTDVELKSMRTAAAARGRGTGTAMLRHLLDRARVSAYSAVWLETGSQDYFAAARRLYARHGFVECGPFADYRPDPNSVFMTLSI